MREHRNRRRLICAGDRINLYDRSARELRDGRASPAAPSSSTASSEPAAKTSGKTAPTSGEKSGKRTRDSSANGTSTEPGPSQPKKTKRPSTTREGSASSAASSTAQPIVDGAQRQQPADARSSVVSETTSTAAADEDVKPGKEQLRQASASSTRPSTPVKSAPVDPPTESVYDTLAVSTAERSTCPGDRTIRRPTPQRRVDRITQPQPYGLSLYLSTIREEQQLPTKRWDMVQHDFVLDASLEKRISERPSIAPDTPFSRLPVQLSVEMVRPAGAETAHWSKSSLFSLNSHHWPVAFPFASQLSRDPVRHARHWSS